MFGFPVVCSDARSIQFMRVVSLKWSAFVCSFSTENKIHPKLTKNLKQVLIRCTNEKVDREQEVQHAWTNQGAKMTLPQWCKTGHHSTWHPLMDVIGCSFMVGFLCTADTWESTHHSCSILQPDSKVRWYPKKNNNERYNYLKAKIYLYFFINI